MLVPVCGLGCPMLAQVLAGFVPDPFWKSIAAYLALALVVFIVFAILKRKFAEKLVKSDFFKGGEYYLGMLAGMVRYACVLLFVLALLNARVYTPAEIAQQAAFDQKNFGGGRLGIRAIISRACPRFKRRFSSNPSSARASKNIWAYC